MLARVIFLLPTAKASKGFVELVGQNCHTKIRAEREFIEMKA